MKQLPVVLNKLTAFLKAQHANQPLDHLSQGPTLPNSSLLQVSPGTPISLVLVSTVPADVHHLFGLPLCRYSPQ